MNDSPFSYDMLQALAVQVSQELYREALVASNANESFFSRAQADIRARLIALRHRFQLGCAIPTRAAAREIEQIQS